MSRMKCYSVSKDTSGFTYVESVKCMSSINKHMCTSKHDLLIHPGKRARDLECDDMTTSEKRQLSKRSRHHFRRNEDK